MRNWKPGDVAETIGGRAFRTEEKWVWWDGSTLPLDFKMSGAGPLLVIDPENREDVERLQRAMWRAWGNEEVMVGDDGSVGAHFIVKAQAALRSLLDPEPEEPTGLGAVVEDAVGCRWVRTDAAIMTSHRNPWIRQNATASGIDKCHWIGLPRPITVLSPGYTEDES